MIGRTFATWARALVVAGPTLAAATPVPGMAATATTAPRLVSKAKLGRPKPPLPPPSTSIQLATALAAPTAPPTGILDQIHTEVAAEVIGEVIAAQVTTSNLSMQDGAFGRLRIASECRRCALGTVSRFELRGAWPADEPDARRLTVAGPPGRTRAALASRLLTDRCPVSPAWDPLDAATTNEPLCLAFSNLWRPDLAPGLYTVTASVPGSSRSVRAIVRLFRSSRPAGPFIVAPAPIAQGDTFRVVLTGRAPGSSVRLSVFRGDGSAGKLYAYGESIDGVVGADGVAEIIVETGPDTVPVDYCFDDGRPGWECHPTHIGSGRP